MTTFDEAFPTAAKLLDERGLLLNAQLLRLVDGDESLFRELREGLIFEGLAEDRFGVGLARIGPAGARASSMPTRSRTESRDAESSLEITFATATVDSLSDEPSRSATTNREELADADWWLMKGGVTRSPFDFATLRVMRRRGEIAPMDLVRHGLRGQWQKPDELAGLADVSDIFDVGGDVANATLRQRLPTAERLDDCRPLRLDSSRPAPNTSRQPRSRAASSLPAPLRASAVSWLMLMLRSAVRRRLRGWGWRPSTDSARAVAARVLSDRPRRAADDAVAERRRVPQPPQVSSS